MHGYVIINIKSDLLGMWFLIQYRIRIDDWYFVSTGFIEKTLKGNKLLNI